MISCTLTLDPAFTVGPVPPRIFGSFVEHMGRCVYEGLFDPGQPGTDPEGFRSDVQDLVRELGVGVVRYPGGNFVSGYNWRDGVGPQRDRPTRLDLAWRTIEPNTFGLDEFMRWVERVGAEPMLAVNLGTAGVAEAVAMLEYTNFPAGTRDSDLRIAHGRPDPYDVKIWCLGNEMDGPWQIGHKTADEYGRLAAETAKAMRLVDPSIELVACGSSHERMATFASWEATVLEHTYEYVDHVSLHAYYDMVDDDRVGFLASADAMDDFIAGVVATCDHVAAKKRTRRRLTLSFDEWNIEPRLPYRPTPWRQAGRISEEIYTAEDAVVVGGLLISLLRNSDRVAIACLAQLVNVMAPIRTERGAAAWRQTIFHPFALTARYARGDVLRCEPRSTEILDSPTRGDVRPVDVVATRDPRDGSLAVFAVNRSVTDSALLDITIGGAHHHRLVGRTTLGGPAWTPGPGSDSLRPMPGLRHHVDRDRVVAQLPPASWTMLRTSPIG